MFTSFVGQFPLCKPSLLSGGCHIPQEQEFSLRSGSHRGESKPCLGSDLGHGPLMPVVFEGLLKPYSLVQQSAIWQVPGPSQDPLFLPRQETNGHCVSPQRVSTQGGGSAIGSHCRCRSPGLWRTSEPFPSPVSHM